LAIAAMKIRDARPADLAALGALEREAFASDRLSPRSMRRFLASPAAILRVAAGRDGIQGYHVTLMRQGGRTARLYSLAVAAPFQGRGVAGTLMADAEATAARRGARALRLEVRRDNARAIRFYLRRGYQQIGTIPLYYADKTDALRYEKALPAAAAVGADGDEDRSPPDLAARHPEMTGKAGPVAPAARVPAAKV
jgi:ribosomal protein S18 acetylase RimI-like enzyme